MGAIHKLKQSQVDKFVRAGKPGKRLGDGGNLYVVRGGGSSAYWTFIATRGGRTCELGGGSARDVGLGRAREWASELRSRGGDLRAEVGERTFKAAADAYLDAFAGTWRRREARVAEWNRAVERCALIEGVSVAELAVSDVLGVVRGLVETPATFHFVLSVVRRVIDREVALGNRSEDRVNPADWKRLGKVLPVRWEKGHHAAMPYEQVPAFVRGLRGRESASARALELLILTGLRKAELLSIRWGWIDWEKCVLTVPAQFMKGGKHTHVVPLTRRAIELLQGIKHEEEGPYVFPGERRMKDGRVEGGETMHVTALKVGPLGLRGYTCHGFRSSLRDYLAEQTDVQGWVAEGVLAHVVAGVEGAYRRGNAIEKRGAALKAWADYIG